MAAVAAGALFLGGSSLLLEFISDDYTVLDRVMTRGPAAILSRSQPLWGYWRPWSREFHFWLIESLAGVRPIAFHAVSLALWLAVLVTFALFVRRLGGATAALIAASGAACLAGFASTLGWAAGAQELWALLFSIAFLHAFASRRTTFAVACLAGALLSKELALVLPALAFAWALLVERDAARRALERVWPYAAVVAVWAIVHPTLLRHAPGAQPAESLERVPVGIGLVRGVLAWVNLHALPAPEHGWLGPVVLGVAAGACFAVGIRLVDTTERPARRGRSPRARAEEATTTIPARGRVLRFAAVWAALGLLPYAMPFIGWQAYYGVFGGLGAWLALGTLLDRRATLATVAIAALAILQLGEVDTPVWAWGGPALQRRNAHLLARLHTDLLAARPKIGAHARLYFADVPRGIGVGHDWFNPAFRVWYHDTTVTSGFLSTYAPRDAAAPRGDDLFFRYGEDGMWREIRTDAEDVARMRLDESWADSHWLLAVTFAQAGDWRASAGQVETLARAYPNQQKFALNMAVCLERLGQPEAAAEWHARADSLAHASR